MSLLTESCGTQREDAPHDCGTDTATIVLERIRDRLAIALTGGRVPAFTVSFGLASSTDAPTFDETLAVADLALLTAKTAGRNRVHLARQPTLDPTTQPEPSRPRTEQPRQDASHSDRPERRALGRSRSAAGRPLSCLGVTTPEIGVLVHLVV